MTTERKSLAAELHDLAMTILTDLEGKWYGDHEGDDLGHVAGYIGVLESQVDDLRRKVYLAEDAYKNMREWAEKNGVDTACSHGASRGDSHG